LGKAPHHDPAGGFRNPWETAPPPGHTKFFRWLRAHRKTRPKPVDPDPSVLPRATPNFPAPRAGADELVVTWVGHCTFLVQVGGLNVLTDPMWSMRAGPRGIAGPKRKVEPAVQLEKLPPIDAVLISHNHYDHLDSSTVKQLARVHPSARWFVPLGLGEFVTSRGAVAVTELDWWTEAIMGPLRFGCTPAQHHSTRTPRDRWKTLWCGWTMASSSHRVYFSGDSALFPGFAEIGEKFGPFDLIFLPIGAYEPREYMRFLHMNPEEAVQVYRELRGTHPGAPAPLFAGMHWGTFKLTDEALDEPPRRIAEAWAAAGLPADSLWVPAFGETRRISAGNRPG
jgi:N-acyl-phosphatidylethanolamine-hydrolysing phospholipase D